jgi:hypothetical protein
MPQQEVDTMHPGQDAHQVQWVELGDEVAQPEATMSVMEQEHRAWESGLLAQVSDLESRVLLYEGCIDELIFANTELHEALEATNSRNQGLRSEPQDDAVQS